MYKTGDLVRAKYSVVDVAANTQRSHDDDVYMIVDIQKNKEGLYCYTLLHDNVTSLAFGDADTILFYELFSCADECLG